MTLEDDLEALVQAKPPLIKKSKHPDHPLTIYNYTDRAQWKKAWNPCTMMARGLVIEQGTSRVVARPMPKFFNYSDGLHKTEDTNRFTVLEKVDGSLGVWFCYKGTWLMATRGSFLSPQAVEGKKMAQATGLEEKCDPSKTYCFEVVYPQDRHLIDYNGRRELVLIAVLDTYTGFDTPNKDLPEVAKALGIRAAESFPCGLLPLDAIHELNRPNEEGFVIRFDSTGERVKIKFSAYMDLAKRGLSGSAPDKKPLTREIVFKRLLANPDDTMENYLERIPDEFYEEAQKAQDEFTSVFAESMTAFDQLVEQYRDTPFKEISGAIPGQNIIFRWLRITRQGTSTQDERVQARRDYAKLLTRQRLL
ncbi:hypothetical protein NA57DRAFT_53712 [Rhizodiscina lignyota]|uniref:T4 RNA ligase 1-like N-terminal domain-containing protein n=1 Tax=Rhizodiscina lignyota TaxID=1504668 RepID=A0A9P4ILS1_9PEZI|nr:hypothetical protein NA57DRAFT_53712 [Rhizodiscina lignyota]